MAFSHSTLQKTIVLYPTNTYNPYSPTEFVYSTTGTIIHCSTSVSLHQQLNNQKMEKQLLLKQFECSKLLLIRSLSIKRITKKTIF